MHKTVTMSRSSRSQRFRSRRSLARRGATAASPNGLAAVRGGFFSTWPPAEDVPAFRGQGAAGRRCAGMVLATMICLVAFAVLFGKLLGDATPLDSAVSRWFVRNRTSNLNEVSHMFSQLADTLTVVGIACAVLLFGFVRRTRNGLIVLAIGMIGEVTMFVTITAIVQRARPAVEHLDMAPPTSSFPSGHTFATVVLWGCLAVVAHRSQWRRWARRVLIVMAAVVPVLVAASRLYRGMHHLTDVTASIVLGTVWLVMLVRIFPLQLGAAREPGGQGAHDDHATVLILRA